MSGFVDEAQLHARAGDGGAGAVSFRREAHVARGGPDGGDGGRGGDVWLVANPNQASLVSFKDHPFRRAGDGTHGSGQRRHGQRGHDVEVPVPVGTVVRDRDGTLLCDLFAPGDRWRAAEGGRGGRGNARFLSNARRAPAFAEQGERGEERWLDLELKLSADVALVGFPNAGKSTLIATISSARPKIADYPFTTLQPHLGVVRVGKAGDETELVVADVPGLVEGAADGKGLGHRFLRHVERARVLVVLVDLAPTAAPPGEQLRILFGELGRYEPALLARPRLVVGSKSDLAGTDPAATAVAGTELAGTVAGTELAGTVAGTELVGTDLAGTVAGTELVDAGGRRVRPVELTISSVTGEGVEELIARMAALVSGSRRAQMGAFGMHGGPSRVVRKVSGHGEEEPEAGTTALSEEVVHRPAPEGIVVERLGRHAWRVEGREARRAVSLSDLTSDAALAEVVRRLRRLGVDRALSRAGVRDGDDVSVGDLSFTWFRGQPAELAEPEGPPGRGSRGGRGRY